jgi:hypothetical protein
VRGGFEAAGLVAELGGEERDGFCLWYGHYARHCKRVQIRLDCYYEEIPCLRQADSFRSE